MGCEEVISMEVKKRPNHQIYMQTLKKLTPEEKLNIVFGLSQLGRNLFFTGLQARYPDLPKEKVAEIYLQRIYKCHNRNY